MHLDLSLGNPSVLQTHRKLRRARKRLQNAFLQSEPRRHCLYLVCFVVLAAAFITVRRWNRSSVSRPGVPAGDQLSHGLAACLSQPVHSLSTFDPFVFSLESRGLHQNEVESRYQEEPWDTLVQTALFPAWSDMRWNIPQYSRGLASDLSTVQKIAANAIGYGASLAPAAPLPYLSRDSQITITYIHHRLDRLRGLQYAIHFVPTTAPRERGSNSSFTMLVQYSFEKKCYVSIARSQVTEPVYILLPYKDREERLRTFFERFAYTRKSGENIVLIVSVLKGSRDAVFVQSLKGQLARTEGTEIGEAVWVHQNDGDVEGSFSRGVALRDAAKLIGDEDAVLFHCDVDMLIAVDFYQRCRRNSISGAQVYYPVFYSLFPYAKKRPVITERNGFWRKTSFGMTCIRKRDFVHVGAYDDAETRFHGWGSEDVFQFEKVRNASHLVAFRAVEPGLLHQWHLKECDVQSASYVDCMKTNFVTMGHPITVGPALVQSLRDVPAFFRALTEM